MLKFRPTPHFRPVQIRVIYAKLYVLWRFSEYPNDVANVKVCLVLSTTSAQSLTTMHPSNVRLKLTTAVALSTLAAAISSAADITATLTANPTANFNLTSDSTISGSTDLALSGDFTNSGASNRLTVNNTGLTTFAGPVWISESTANRSLTFSGTGNILISGAIGKNAAGGSASTNGNFSYSGSGILTLAGANTFGGSIGVSGGGTVSVSNLSTATPTSISFFRIGGGTSTSTGRLLYTGSGETYNKQIGVGTAVGDSVGIIDQTGTGQLTLSGGVTASHSGNKTLILQGSTNGAVAAITKGLSTSFALIKQGAGTWSLSGVNDFTGTTTVEQGTLTLTGSLASTRIAVGNGATFDFQKSGTNVLTRNFTLTEGASLIGSATNSFASSGTTTLAADLSDGFTAITLGATFTASGILNFDLTNISEGVYGLFSGTTPTGAFTSVVGTGFITADNFTGTVNGFNYSFNNSSNTLSISAVPEPATYGALAGLGILGFAVYRRRRAS